MKSATGSRIAQRTLVPIVCGLTLLAAGCGYSSSSGSAPYATAPATTAAPHSVLCADAAALRASLDKLAHVSTPAGAVEEIKTDLAAVEADLKTFANDTHDQWHAQTAALQSALGKLKTAVSDLAANPSPSTASDVTTALGGVSTAARNLLDAVDTACPAASAPASS